MMTEYDFKVLKLALLQLEDEKYWDSIIQELILDREALIWYRENQKPFTTRPLFNDYTNINVVS